MSEQSAESAEPAAEYQRPWWQSRGFAWGIVSVLVLLLVGWLVSAIFNPNPATNPNTFASVVTGMLYSFAGLLALVLFVYVVSRVRQTTRTQEQ